MEQTLQLLNPKVLIGEPDPIIKFHCKTPERSKDGLRFEIGCTLSFRNDVKEIKFELMEFKTKEKDTRYYRVSVTLDIHLFNFLTSNIQTANLIMDDDASEMPEEKVKKMKLILIF
jgi:hypothetical protein